MKATRYLQALLLIAAIVTGNTAFSATTGELLQQGLYAEEVEGNIESAIKAYDQVIKAGSAPANHVAQALYRQGMCYLKMKNEAAAREALEKLVTQYSSQTDIVEKALPILDELTDFDPATLMPPGTLVYVELGSPGRQVETLLTMLKGTPYENPLAAVGSPSGGNANQNSNQKTPADVVGALLNPAMMAEFKKIRSSAVGIMGFENNHPQMVCVLYPGKSDALRGIILAALGMAGKPGDTLEGMQTVMLPEDMAVAHDERVVILARPAKQLEWSVKKYKGKITDAALATSNASFAKLNKSQRQKNVLTAWVNVDEVYGQLGKIMPDGKIPPQLQVANAILDFKNIDDLILSESLETDGTATRLEFQFKDGHHCLAYDLIRTPNINKAALQAAPADAVAVASLALSAATAAQAETVRSHVQNVTGLDIGREIFSNIEQVTLFAMPGAEKSTNIFLPGRFGLALTSRNPAQTRQVIDTLLATLNPTSPGQKSDDSKGVKISGPGEPDRYCHIRQVNNITLLSLDRALAEASAASIKNQKSIRDAGPLSKAVNRLAADTSKLILVNVGGAIRLVGPAIQPPGLDEEKAKQFAESLEKLAHCAANTVIEYRTDESANRFAMNHSINPLPPFSEIVGPVAQINRIMNEARAEALAGELRRSKPATTSPSAPAPAIGRRPGASSGCRPPPRPRLGVRSAQQSQHDRHRFWQWRDGAYANVARRLVGGIPRVVG